MEIRINSIGELEKELSITTPWEIVETDYKDIIKKYSQQPFKGFRKGNAPIGAVESFFRNNINNELISSTSARLCRKALEEKNMEAGTPIEISEIEISKNKYLRFKANFIEMPRFKLPDYLNLNLESKERNDRINEISQKLLQQTDISLHRSFIENELKYTDEAEKSTEIKEKEAIERVKLMLILKKIAKQENIEVHESELETRINAIATENEITPSELKEFLIIHNGLSRLADLLLAETVLNFISEE